MRREREDGSRIKRIARIARIARMKGENQPHKNVGAVPPCSPKDTRRKKAAPVPNPPSSQRLATSPPRLSFYPAVGMNGQATDP